MVYFRHGEIVERVSYMKSVLQYRVMIAHGDPTAQRQISRALEATKQFQIIFTTYNGEECIRQAIRRRPDLVIADALLAGADGLEVLRQIKTRCSDVQVILLTDYSSLVSHRTVLEHADYCIIAPYSNAVLAQRAVDTMRMRQDESFPVQLVRSQTVAVLSALGAPVQLKGYSYLRDAIQLSVYDPDILRHHVGPNGLYAQLCQRYQESYHNIEHCMRSVSDHIFKNTRLSVLESYFTTVDLARGRVCNLTLVSTLAARVTENLNSLQEQEEYASVAY